MAATARGTAWFLPRRTLRRTSCRSSGEAPTARLSKQGERRDRGRQEGPSATRHSIFRTCQTTGEVHARCGRMGKRCLFVVNAGSNSVSSFVVRPDGIALADQAPSNGESSNQPYEHTAGAEQHGAVRPELGTSSGTSIFNSSSGSASIQGFLRVRKMRVDADCRLGSRLTTSQASSPTAIAFNHPGYGTLGGGADQRPRGGGVTSISSRSTREAWPGLPIVSPSAGNEPLRGGVGQPGQVPTVTNWDGCRPTSRHRLLVPAHRRLHARPDQHCPGARATRAGT